ncbi:MAG: PQQ-binding-like beta-propeller repeat protein [Planctomycetota bacterium]
MSIHQNPIAVLAAIMFSLLFVVAGQVQAQVGANEQSAKEQSSIPSNWSSWRGHDGTGSSLTAKPPTKWSEDKNIKWKTELPGLGHATPVVWGDTVFVLTSIPVGEMFDPIPDRAPGSHDNLRVSQRWSFVALAVDRTSGKIKWQRELHKAIPHEGAHVSASLASASPVTDGKHLVASFGSHGIYCLDMEGQLIWKRTVGVLNTKHGHGEGASPTLFDDTLIVNCDHEGQSFMIAFDVHDGAERWRVKRDEVTSWSSPIVYVHEDQPQVIVAGTTAVRGYDFKTGKVIWSCTGLSNNIVATPIAKDGFVYVGSSYEIKAMMAIRLKGAKGDITGNPDFVIWRRASRTPYVPTPLLLNKKLYFLRHYQGILSIVDVKSGDEPIGPYRISALRDIYASPVAADGKIFLTDRDGTTVVLSEPEMPKVISVNRLGDSFSASMVLVDNQIILRGERFLYCIEEAERP